MKIFLAIVALLFSVPAFGQSYLGEDGSQGPECKGVIYGVVVGQDGKLLGGIGLILEPAGSHDYVFPRTKADDQGQYRFSDVPCGSWGVFVDDKEAGYPQASRMLNWFLYGAWIPPVTITKKKTEVLFDVTAPPKPAQLRVHLINSKTKAKISRGEIRLKLNRKREIQYSCTESLVFSCEDDDFLVPPDLSVSLHVTSKGFHEWNESAGRGKVIRIPAGETLTLSVELNPIQN